MNVTDGFRFQIGRILADITFIVIPIVVLFLIVLWIGRKKK